LSAASRVATNARPCRAARSCPVVDTRSSGTIATRPTPRARRGLPKAKAKAKVDYSAGATFTGPVPPDRQYGMFKKGLCAYCGAPSSTVDHVPPGSFFPRPRPSDLITVPSCVACNNRSSADEEYFLNVLMSHHRAEGPFVDALRAERFAETKKNPRTLRMARHMLSRVRMIRVQAPEGEQLRPALKGIRADRLERVFEKICRGLYFREYGEPARARLRSITALDPSNELLRTEAVGLVLTAGLGGKVGRGEFEYRILRNSDSGATACFLLFWRALSAFVWLMRPKAIARVNRRRSKGLRRHVRRTKAQMRLSGSLANGPSRV
jgi:hypothetical protein